ncbi:transcription antitermination factor NusB, partial [Bacteroidales bacterium OttesenSCG-928-C19]|nr:transcription antitermination factor NusB [Bacteroidales bacterium OttesenSCG-928-C19]
DASQKYFPEASEQMANEKFVKNEVVSLLVSNGDFKKKKERLKINWADIRDIFRTIYSSFKAQDSYKSYLQKETPSFEDDRQVVSELFKYTINYPALVDKFIEKNLFWEDDFFQIAQLSYNTLRSLEESFDEYSELPEFFKKDDEDKLFMIDLFRKTILHEDKLTELIKRRISNWEYERIAVMDIILVKMAIVEFMYFPSIPVKVTINEYIELSKEFSTEKSKTFVNAILDKIVVDLKEEGLLKKTGRGLING